MPILQPGKRPARRFARSRVLGARISHGRKPLDTTLNVVPMVDIMTILVLFLLQQFSATGEVSTTSVPASKIHFQVPSDCRRHTVK